MRFRPRFTVRTLAIFVLVCAYFGAWEATKRLGLESPTKLESYLPFENRWVTSFESPETSPMPFVICRNGPRWETDCLSLGEKRSFYVWLFGLKIKLPIEWEVE